MFGVSLATDDRLRRVFREPWVGLRQTAEHETRAGAGSDLPHVVAGCAEACGHCLRRSRLANGRSGMCFASIRTQSSMSGPFEEAHSHRISQAPISFPANRGSFRRRCGQRQSSRTASSDKMTPAKTKNRSLEGHDLWRLKQGCGLTISKPSWS